MREIMFRAWCDPGEPSHAVMLYSGGDLSEFFDAADFDPIMQYTGLEDENGKRIYTGDIVKQYFPAPWDDKNQIAIYGQITFGDPFPGCFCFVNHKMDNTCCLYEIGDEDGGYGVVVGNIYENPELLKI